MGAIASQTKRMGMTIFFGVVTLLFTNSTIIADTQSQKPPAKRIAKTKTSHEKKSDKPQLIITTEEDALATFDAFTIEWMQKLVQTEDFHKTQAQVVESPDGFAVEYVGYIPDRLIKVKKTDSSDTPYVGILTYSEKKLRCAGKTKEEALQGPFEQVETNPVSEIFRFTKGKWVY